LSEDIEKWGSGLKRISEECKLNDIKVEFKIMKYGFSVIFYRNAPVNAPVNLNQTEEKIISEIKKNNRITYDELSAILEIHRTTIMRSINKLKERKILVREGSDKTGWWVLK